MLNLLHRVPTPGRHIQWRKPQVHWKHGYPASARRNHVTGSSDPMSCASKPSARRRLAPEERTKPARRRPGVSWRNATRAALSDRVTKKGTGPASLTIRAASATSFRSIASTQAAPDICANASNGDGEIQCIVNGKPVCVTIAKLLCQLSRLYRPPCGHGAPARRRRNHAPPFSKPSLTRVNLLTPTYQGDNSREALVSAHDFQCMSRFTHRQNTLATLRVSSCLRLIPCSLSFVEHNNSFSRWLCRMGIVGKKTVHVLECLRRLVSRLA